MVIDYNNLRGWKLSDLLFSPSLFRSSSLLDGTMMMMINAFAWLYQSWIHTIVRHFRYLVMSIHSDVIFTALFGKTACIFFPSFSFVGYFSAVSPFNGRIEENKPYCCIAYFDDCVPVFCANASASVRKFLFLFYSFYNELHCSAGAPWPR